MRISDESIAKTVFGSPLRRRILSFLFKNQEPVSERELSRILGVSHTAVNKAMKQLLGINIIKGKTIGTALVWELNTNSFAYAHVKAFITASEISPLESLKEMIKTEVGIYNLLVTVGRENKESWQAGAPLILEAYIIGSIAEGTSRPDSDIDLLLIVEDNYDMESIKSVLSERALAVLEKYGNKLSPHLYCQKDVEKNEPNWLRNAIGKGIRVC